MDDHDFGSLIAAARDGDERALTELYRALYPRLVRYLGAAEATEAEDLASETWLDVARGLTRFRGDEPAFRAWAFTIARRRVLDLRRRRGRRRTAPRDPHLMGELGPTGDVEQEALDSLAAGSAVALIASALPSDQAEVVLLRVIADLSVDDVARVTGKRPGTVRVLQHRAIRRLARIVLSQGVTL